MGPVRRTGAERSPLIVRYLLNATKESGRRREAPPSPQPAEPRGIGAHALQVGSEEPGPRGFHRRLEGYSPSPLTETPELASELGVARLFVKDESSRLGLPSFKILGASWAVYRALGRHIGGWGDWERLADLNHALKPHKPLALAAATDGNHGRAVARMARLLGLEARIFVPHGTAPARIDAIRDEGASCRVVNGTYDDAVDHSAGEASERCLVVSDTSWPGYEEVPAWVIEGYSTIFAEASE